ncbi:hypothetical protein AYI69_g6197 [Smittium culicis]|uniref:Uncharacterized protein n=1 Tax=Smittium culicis TaxID=133412 RepID=A0A1R1Y0I7_9FUNG|nr:hypothetical protein AYI69_g6197 [Smittium culicis]
MRASLFLLAVPISAMNYLVRDIIGFNTSSISLSNIKSEQRVIVGATSDGTTYLVSGLSRSCDELKSTVTMFHKDASEYRLSAMYRKITIGPEDESNTGVEFRISSNERPSYAELNPPMIRRAIQPRVSNDIRCLLLTVSGSTIRKIMQSMDRYNVNDAVFILDDNVDPAGQCNNKKFTISKVQGGCGI